MNKAIDIPHEAAPTAAAAEPGVAAARTAKVFIGLPVYNGQTCLAEAIESVLSQTFGDFTLFISDNASTDATEEISRRFAAADPRVVYHRHTVNMGAAPDFNFCVDAARGSYFKWMAHDDKLAPEYLERCVELLDADPGAVLCHAGVISIDAQGRRTVPYDLEHDFNDPDVGTRFARAMALDHACVTVFGVIRLDALKQTPKIAPFVGSDRSLLAELALHGTLEYAQQRLFLWREHKTRSVRMKRSDRVAWFDAKANATFATLYLRQLLAAQGAAFRAPLPFRTRLTLLQKTVSWAFVNRARLYQDARACGKAVLGGLPGARRG